VTPRDFFGSRDSDDYFAWDDLNEPDQPIDVATTREWNSLVDVFETVRGRHLRDLLAESGRRTAMTLEVGDLYLDFTRHRATPEHPQYEIRSDKTDHVAAHRGEVLTRL